MNNISQKTFGPFGSVLLQSQHFFLERNRISTQPNLRTNRLSGNDAFTHTVIRPVRVRIIQVPVQCKNISFNLFANHVLRQRQIVRIIPVAIGTSVFPCV